MMEVGSTDPGRARTMRLMRPFLFLGEGSEGRRKGARGGGREKGRCDVNQHGIGSSRSCFLCLSSPSYYFCLSVLCSSSRCPPSRRSVIHTHTHTHSLSLFFFRFGYLISVCMSIISGVCQPNLGLSPTSPTSLSRCLSPTSLSRSRARSLSLYTVIPTHRTSHQACSPPANAPCSALPRPRRTPPRPTARPAPRRPPRS